MRTMYDSVSPGSIPAGATMVAGYADGLYANVTELRARFPGAVVVSIAVRYTTRAQVLDVETGDATAAQAVLWCRQTMADTSNSHLTVYCNTSTWPSVRAAFQAAGETEPQYWVAQYDGVAAVPAGAVAKQFRNTPGWDESVVVDYWPGVDPTPTPTPAPPEDVVTPQDIQAFVAAMKTELTTDPAIRDTFAFAGFWWLGYVLKGEVPPGANAGWASVIGDAHAQLEAFIEARVEAALKAGVVQVQVDVTGPAPAPAVKA